MTSPLSRRDLVRAAVLAVFAIALWFVSRTRWSEDSWLSAPEYDIDALETLARIKLTGEQGWSFFIDKHIPRLGAPFGADWSSYPMPDLPVFWLLGKLANVVGLVAVGHFALLLSCLLNLLTFFFCSRVLGHRPVFAAGAAMLFAFSHYNISRGLSHYSLTLSFTVPAILLSAWLVGSSRKMLQRTRWRILCFATAAVTATGSPYYGLMFLILFATAITYQFFNDRRRQNLRSGIGSLVVWGLVTALCNFTAITGMFRSTDRVLHRSYASTEINGLRPVEWMVPPPYHRLPAAAQFSEEYGRLTLFEGEYYSSYLGVVAFTGVALIVVRFLRSLLRGRAGLRPAHAPTIAVIVAFGMVGGFNSLVALSITTVFRGSNRYTVFILAISLFAMAALASARWRRLQAWVGRAIVAALVGLALWDQMRRVPGQEELTLRAREPAVDQQLGARLEELLPAGSMIFQLPAVPFLEQRQIVGMTDYEHFRPFFFTTTMRFSYGVLATEDAVTWQRRVARMPPEEMRAELESVGFAAVYVNRLAFADAAKDLRRRVEALGLPVIFDAGWHLVFRLQPSASPRLPVLTGPNRFEPWDGAAWDASKLAMLEGKGWFVPETNAKSSWRWGRKEAVSVLWNPHQTTRSVTLRCRLIGRSVNHLTIALAGGRELWHGELNVIGVPCSFDLELPPGETRLQWTYHGTPMRGSPVDKRMLCFSVNDVVVEDR